MMYTRVYDKYILFALVYTTNHIFTILLINHLVYKYDEPTTPHKLTTGMKPSVSNLPVFSPHVLYER